MEEGKYVFIFNKINKKAFSKIEKLKWKSVNKKNKIIFTYSKEQKQIKNPEKNVVRFNSKNGEFECQKYIDYELLFKNYKNLRTSIIGNHQNLIYPYPIFAEYEISKLHYFIKNKVLDIFNINNYGFGGDFIIFDDMSAILIEYDNINIYKKIKKGYIKKLDTRNIFQKIMCKFTK
jgi:hypothetical protein